MPMAAASASTPSPGTFGSGDVASANVMKTPASLELRRMQMLTEIGAEQNTMTVVMMPSEFVEAARALGQMKK